VSRRGSRVRVPSDFRHLRHVQNLGDIRKAAEDGLDGCDPLGCLSGLWGTAGLVGPGFGGQKYGSRSQRAEESPDRRQKMQAWQERLEVAITAQRKTDMSAAVPRTVSRAACRTSSSTSKPERRCAARARRARLPAPSDDVVREAYRNPRPSRSRQVSEGIPRRNRYGTRKGLTPAG